MGFSDVRKSQITDMVLLAIAFSMLEKEKNDMTMKWVWLFWKKQVQYGVDFKLELG